MTQPLLSTNGHPILLGQMGHEWLPGFKFMLAAPWSACRLCGAVYQTDTDRFAYRLCMENDDGYLAVYEESCRMRDHWRKTHERQNHTQQEIDQLARSGYAVTPEAAHNLAPYGIIPIGDSGNVYLIDEIDQALYEAPRAPYNDAEG